MSKQQKPQLGDIVAVTWLDAQGFMNELRSKVKVAEATTIGTWIVDDPKFITLQHCIYTGNAEDPEGDYTVIPKGVGWIKGMRVVERVAQ